MHSNSSKTKQPIFEETFIIGLFKIQTLKKWARDGLYATYFCVLAFVLIAVVAILKTIYYSTPCQFPPPSSTDSPTTTGHLFYKPCARFFIPFRKRYIFRSPLLFRLSPVSSSLPCLSRHSRFPFISCLVFLPCLPMPLPASQLRSQPYLLTPSYKSPQNLPVFHSFESAFVNDDKCKIYLSEMTNEDLVEYLKFNNDSWKHCQGVYLHLTKHLSKVITKNWISGLENDVIIKELEFRESFIKEIESNAFDGNHFSAMENLAVKDNVPGIYIHENIFGDTPIYNLKKICFESSLITHVDINAFKNLNALIHLCFPKSIGSSQILKNITVNKFDKLEVLEIQDNTLENISPDIFQGMPGLISLYLHRNAIRTIDHYSFTNLQKLVQLFISDNLIETMNEAVGIVSKISNVDAKNNRWHCDCKLEWFKKYFKTVDQSPTCSTPNEHSGKRLLEVDFNCDENPETTTTENTGKPTKTTVITEGSSSISTTIPSTSSISTTPITQVPTSTPNANISVTPVPTSTPNSNISTAQVPTSTPNANTNTTTSPSNPDYQQCDFSVIGDDKILKFNLTNCDKSKIKKISIHSSGDDRQLINVQDTLESDSIKDDTSYVVCILYGEDDLIQPSQCKAARTLPAPRERSWIPKKFKSMICGIFVGSLFVLFIFGAATAFCVIKKNPEVLKGSNRVLIVKRHGVAALILPKGYETPSQDYTEGTYYHGNNSTISGNSSVYMRPVPPSVSDFIYWREKYYGTGFAPSLPPRNEEPYYSEALETGANILM